MTNRLDTSPADSNRCVHLKIELLANFRPFERRPLGIPLTVSRRTGKTFLGKANFRFSLAKFPYTSVPDLTDSWSIVLIESKLRSCAAWSLNFNHWWLTIANLNFNWDLIFEMILILWEILEKLFCLNTPHKAFWACKVEIEKWFTFWNSKSEFPIFEFFVLIDMCDLRAKFWLFESDMLIVS